MRRITYQIQTEIEWAGMSPPESTVSRRELVVRCKEAGEGAIVEYEMELDVRSNGVRGVKGYDLSRNWLRRRSPRLPAWLGEFLDLALILNGAALLFALFLLVRISPK
jgi:hypothetical protein